MIFAKVFTKDGNDAVVEWTFEDIWDVNISPATLTGAFYYSQESRTASWTMHYDSLFDTGLFTGDWNAWIAYRAYGQLWLNYSYYYDGSLVNTSRCIFQGYFLTENAFERDTVGVYSQGSYTRQARLIKVKMVDYLGLFQRMIEEYYPTTTLTQGEVISIPAEYSRIWDLITASDSSTTIPLWTASKPGLRYDLDEYPDYSVSYNHYEMFHQTLSSQGNVAGTWAACIHEVDDDIIFEDIQLNRLYNGSFYLFYSYYAKYKVTGAGMLMLAGYPVTAYEGQSGSPAGVSATEVFDTLTDDEYSDYWDDWQQLVIDNTPQDTIYTIEDQDGVNYLYLDGNASITTVTIIQDAEVDTLEWLRYLLTLQFGCLISKDEGRSYVIDNKAFLLGDTSGFGSWVKIYDYKDALDAAVDEYSGGISAVADNDSNISRINTFAKNNRRNWKRSCEFTTNGSANLNDYVVLPPVDGTYVFGATQIQITEKWIDPTQPGVYRYKGRAR